MVKAACTVQKPAEVSSRCLGVPPHPLQSLLLFPPGNEHVNEAAYQRLHDLEIEPSTPDRLERVFVSASSAFEEALLHRDCRPVATGDIS
jgi:hypothetical protein